MMGKLDPKRSGLTSSRSMGTPGSCFDERMARAVFTWLTFFAGVKWPVKNF